MGYFSVGDMVRLLSVYRFRCDKQKELLEAFREIDQDADGFIPKSEMVQYMQQMGEPLEEHEINYLLDLAHDPSSDKPDEIDIERLSWIMVPSDDIIEDLTQQANAAIKQAELEAKA